MCFNYYTYNFIVIKINYMIYKIYIFTYKDIFNSIFSRNIGPHIEVVMQEYEKTKMLDDEFERRLCCQNFNIESVEQVVQEISVPVVPTKKKYIWRMLKVKPEEAIGEDFIKCCICGQEGDAITSAHLKKYDMTVEEYKKLCLYPREQALISRKREYFTRNLVKRT